MANLTIKNLCLTVGKRTLIEDINCEFRSGRIIALVGDNGSGKTTLLRTLAGLDGQGAGHVFVDESDLYAISLTSRAQIISFLLQHSPEQPYCTAYSRIAHGLMPTLGYHHFVDEPTRELIELTAQRLNIHHLLNRILAKMSGGEQRLVHIAKCLINPNVKILLLDEPSVFLDFTQQTKLISVLSEQKDLGRLVIFSSHDAEFIRRIADEVLLVQNQHIHVLPHHLSSLSDLSSNRDMAVLADTPSYST